MLFQLGYEIDSEQVENIFWRFKAVADQKKVSTSKWLSYCPFFLGGGVNFIEQVKFLELLFQIYRQRKV